MNRSVGRASPLAISRSMPAWHSSSEYPITLKTFQSSSAGALASSFDSLPSIFIRSVFQPSYRRYASVRWCVYPYEVRDEKEYFDEIQDVKVTKDTLCLRSSETAMPAFIGTDISQNRVPSSVAKLNLNRLSDILPIFRTGRPVANVAIKETPVALRAEHGSDSRQEPGRQSARMETGAAV